MDRLNKIINHPVYRDCVKQIRKCEQKRIFCHHDMGHFLDVARLAYIISLEENIAADKELIYAAALLHDIGRHCQYKDGTPHEIASADIAVDILKDCGFDASEMDLIIEAIRQHRNKESAGRQDLTGIIYRADMLSRSCFGCAA